MACGWLPGFGGFLQSKKAISHRRAGFERIKKVRHVVALIPYPVDPDNDGATWSAYHT